MKRKYLVFVTIGFVAFFAIFMLTKTIAPINEESVKLRIYNHNSEGDFVELIINDAQFIEKINDTITGKIYYNQPFIETYNRDEVDYEIRVYNYDQKRIMQSRYRIFLNDDDNPDLINMSRVDMINMKTGFSLFDRSCSLKLTNEQKNRLMEVVKAYIPN